jgi:hypothetical protein
VIQSFIPQAGQRRCSASGWREVVLVGTPATPRVALALQRRQDHNDGILLARTLDDYLRKRRVGSRRFFAGLWGHPMVRDLREEAAVVTARWQADRQGSDRAAFDRMHELRSWEFAKRAWGPEGPPFAGSPRPASGRARRQVH